MPLRSGVHMLQWVEVLVVQLLCLDVARDVVANTKCQHEDASNPDRGQDLATHR